MFVAESWRSADRPVQDNPGWGNSTYQRHKVTTKHGICQRYRSRHLTPQGTAPFWNFPSYLSGSPFSPGCSVAPVSQAGTAGPWGDKTPADNRGSVGRGLRRDHAGANWPRSYFRGSGPGTTASVVTGPGFKLRHWQHPFNSQSQTRSFTSLNLCAFTHQMG